MHARVLLVVVIAAVSVPLVAGAHGDPNADGSRCDTWSRSGHTGGHHHPHPSDVPLGDPLGTVVHAQSGHYVVRNSAGYIEVVGGQAYRGPDPAGNDFPGQGGYAQGEVDVVPGAPDADFNIAVFGPDADNPPAADAASIASWVNGSYGKVCVNAAGQQHSAQTRSP